MNRKTVITSLALMLAWTGLAHSALEKIEEAFELDLTQVTLPAHRNARVFVKACDACDRVTLQANGRTTYHDGGRRVTLEEFQAVVAEVSNPRNGLVYVMYEPESSIVTRIMLSATNR